MNILDAVDGRLSCRSFFPRPVEPGVLREIVERAGRAASGGNLQPWHAHVVSGAALEDLKKRVAEIVATGDPRHTPAEYAFQPDPLYAPYNERRHEHGVEMYSALGIDRSDAAARLQQYRRNFELFGAPAAIFLTLDRRLGPSQWADLGGFLATILYLARGFGLETCPQQSWARMHTVLRPFLDLPPEQMVFCAVAIGYGDREAPVNSFRSSRAALSDYARFIE